MAQLAVEYLLDSKGLGKSPEDLAAVMLDMGISQADYAVQFFARMDTYLPRSEFPYGAVALGLAVLLAAGVMSGSLVWGWRRWPALVTESGAPVYTRPARKRFVTEVSAFACLAVGFVTLGLLAMRWSHIPRGASRAPGSAVIAGYFVGSAGILVSAIRLWGKRSRLAYLVPPLVIFATVIAIALLERLY